MTEHNPIPSKEEVELRKKEIKNTLCCPHCGERLKKWAVPQTMFTTWPNEFMYICFNDECHYLIRSFEAVARMGNSGSYRLLYDPDTDTCQPVPVLNKTALKESIVEESDEVCSVAEKDVTSEEIAGMWSLVSVKMVAENGQVSLPMGAELQGVLNYTPDGQISVQNMRADGTVFKTPDGVPVALETYGAYNGRYELTGEGRIIHQIEVSLFPDWVDLKQERNIQLEGKRLTLTGPSILVDGVIQTAQMTWEKTV